MEKVIPLPKSFETILYFNLFDPYKVLFQLNEVPMGLIWIQIRSN
jgi:hypothetical protein